jgi:hypothetical protein
VEREHQVNLKVLVAASFIAVCILVVALLGAAA